MDWKGRYQNLENIYSILSIEIKKLTILEAATTKRKANIFLRNNCLNNYALWINAMNVVCLKMANSFCSHIAANIKVVVDA